MSDATQTYMSDTIRRLSERFPIAESRDVREDLAFVQIDPTHAVELITHLRDREGYTHLVFLTAVDYIEDGLFRLTYLLHNYARHVDLGVEVDIDRESARAETIHHLWAQAATYERELKEMFGIDFPGSPRVDEPFILESWPNEPPMRREFDTKAYSENTYFHRPAPRRGVLAQDADGSGSDDADGEDGGAQ